MNFLAGHPHFVGIKNFINKENKKFSDLVKLERMQLAENEEEAASYIYNAKRVA